MNLCVIRHTIENPLAECLELFTSLGDNTLRGKDLPRPVVLLLGTVIANNSGTVVLAVPEHTAVQVLGVGLELTAEEVTASVVAEVVEAGSLDRLKEDTVSNVVKTIIDVGLLTHSPMKTGLVELT